MRKLLFLSLFIVSSAACGANFPVHQRLVNAIFPVELGGVEYNARENYSIVHGRAYNNTGAEQNDIGMTLTLYRDDRPVHKVTADLGHMFDKTYSFFNIMVRGTDLRDTDSFGVELVSGLHDRLYTQSPDIWDTYHSRAATDVMPVHGDAMFPVEQLYVDPLRLHQGSRVEGLIHNISREDLNDAWFELAFFDSDAKLMDSLRIHAGHVSPGESVVFTGTSRRDDLNQWASYTLRRETVPFVREAVDEAAAARPAPAVPAAVEHPVVEFGRVAPPQSLTAMTHTYVNSRKDFELQSLRVVHDKDKVTEVRGRIASHSAGDLKRRTYFTAVFFDQNNRKTGSMNFTVRSLKSGDSVYFRTTHTQGNFENTHRYQLYID